MTRLRIKHKRNIGYPQKTAVDITFDEPQGYLFVGYGGTKAVSVSHRFLLDNLCELYQGSVDGFLPSSSYSLRVLMPSDTVIIGIRNTRPGCMPWSLVVLVEDRLPIKLTVPRLINLRAGSTPFDDDTRPSFLNAGFVDIERRVIGGLVGRRSTTVESMVSNIMAESDNED